ncbi:CBS domain-containing protein [Chloroflexota bacterium]
MKVKDLLIKKGRSVITIGSDETLATAVKKLVDNNIGALPVCDAKGTLVGIISERDLLKECSQRSSDISNTKVKDVMVRGVIICVPEDDLVYIMNIMAQKGIRHLPVLDGPKLTDIISMRDAVDAQLDDSKATVRFLSEYISGGAIG